jgi:hypothetical protein
VARLWAGRRGSGRCFHTADCRIVEGLSARCKAGQQFPQGLKPYVIVRPSMYGLKPVPFMPKPVPSR